MPMTNERLAANDSPEHWMQRVAEGDTQAFRHLAALLGQRMFALAMRLTRSNRAQAEDIVQDALIKLWQSAPRWQPTGSVASYAARIVYTCAMDQFRHKRLEALPEGVELAEAEQVTTRLMEKQQQRHVADAMQQLPERQREALLLFYFHEHTMAEVAVSLQTTEKAVESLLGRARKQLAARLPEDAWVHIARPEGEYYA